MKFRILPLVASMVCAAAATQAFSGTNDTKVPAASHKVDLQQVRNATVKINYGGTTFLIDPMLAKRVPTQDLKTPTAATCAIHWLT